MTKIADIDRDSFFSRKKPFIYAFAHLSGFARQYVVSEIVRYRIGKAFLVKPFDDNKVLFRVEQVDFEYGVAFS